MIGSMHMLAEAMGGESRLLLSIEIPEVEDPLEVMGEVIWYNLTPKGSDFRFRAGVLFRETGEAFTKKWQEFLATIRKKWIF
jgi:hypothetical protein